MLAHARVFMQNFHPLASRLREEKEATNALVEGVYFSMYKNAPLYNYFELLTDKDIPLF